MQWGLAVNGQAGVKSALDLLRTVFDIALALASCASVSAITRSLVVHQ